MQQDQKVVVAISARNEAATIYRCLESVQKSLRLCGISAQIDVCANGCQDGTAEVVRHYTARTKSKNISLVEVANGGLVNSQRILVARNYADAYIFIDADATIAPRTIGLLLQSLKGDVVLAYARTILHAPPRRLSLIPKIYSLYASGNLLTPRYYFHGRCFATRVWRVPSDASVSKRASQDPTLSRFGYLQVDDVYLSAYILKEFGQKAIKEVSAARVYSRGISSAYDWWRVYRRTSLEVMKIFKWFPEFNDIRHLLVRKTDWAKWSDARLSYKLLWLYYLLMKFLFRVRLFSEILIIRWLNNQPQPQWLRAESTKRAAGTSPKLILFDLDQTLVSANKNYYQDPSFKRTLADLINRGSIVGINTHRSLEGATAIYKDLGMNGPLIVEGGFLALVPNNQAKFKEIIPSGTKKGVLHNRLLEEISHLTIDKSVTVKLSKGRDFTQSIYVYSNGQPSGTNAKKIMHQLNSRLREKGIIVEEGTIPGKLHAYSPGFSKVSTASLIRSACYKNRQLILIGDDEAREISRPHNTFLLGVKDSEDSYRRICQFVATKSGVRGLRQILRYIEAI